MAYIEINNLKVDHKSFEGIRNVLDVDHLEIEKGTTYGIVGESGSGKTVLALTILKMLQCPPGIISSGSIKIDGMEILDKSEHFMENQIRGSKVTMIFQDPMSSLNPVFTVGTQLKNVIERRKGLKGKACHDEILHLLDVVELPDAESTMAKYPHQLSGGQRQRIIIALALACGCEFLIADEPTRNLDVTIQASILKLLKGLQRDFGLTVLFIANNLSLVSAFCDEVGILYHGKIIERGTPAKIIGNPENEYTKALIEAVKTRTRPSKEDSSNEVILKVDHLKKYFDVSTELHHSQEKLKAVDGVSFELKRGEVLGIVGESGCGKSTLVNTILKLYEPTSGHVYFNGQDIFNMNDREVKDIHKKIQIVFQDPYWSLNPRWLIKDIIAEPIVVHEKCSRHEMLEKVRNLLKMVDLPEESAYMYPHEFSGGERQRIAIARSLASKPELVVLDEPTSSIDVFSQAKILALLKKLKGDFNLTNILISHDLSVVSQMANKIAVMYLGKIVEYGNADLIFNNPKHPYTVALFNAIPQLNTNGVDALTILQGNVPSAIHLPTGCRFHTRCNRAMAICSESEPQEKEVDGRMVGCWLYENKKN